MSDLTGYLNAIGQLSGLLNGGSIQGLNAYQIWLADGHTGTVEDYLASLAGATGGDGKSAYQYAVDGGYTGTEAEFTALMNIRPHLIATYTHTTNKEVVVSAVDVDNDLFTSVGHGLSIGDSICPILNLASGAIFLLDKCPGGLAATTGGYYVANDGFTVDTFKLSITKPADTIVDITANVNMDLTKWHFERFSSEPIITNLPANLKKCRVIIHARNLRIQVNLRALPLGVGYNPEWITSLAGSLYYPSFCNSRTGDCMCEITVDIDYTNNLTLDCKYAAVWSNTATANGFNQGAFYMMSPNYKNGVITSLIFYAAFFANGSVVEVYTI